MAFANRERLEEIEDWEELSALRLEVKRLRSSLRNCRNDLCVKCGEYKNRQDFSMCRMCRWRDGEYNEGWKKEE